MNTPSPDSPGNPFPRIITPIKTPCHHVALISDRPKAETHLRAESGIDEHKWLCQVQKYRRGQHRDAGTKRAWGLGQKAVCHVSTSIILLVASLSPYVLHAPLESETRQIASKTGHRRRLDDVSNSNNQSTATGQAISGSNLNSQPHRQSIANPPQASGRKRATATIQPLSPIYIPDLSWQFRCHHAGTPYPDRPTWLR